MSEASTCLTDSIVAAKGGLMSALFSCRYISAVSQKTWALCYIVNVVFTARMYPVYLLLTMLLAPLIHRLIKTISIREVNTTSLQRMYFLGLIFRFSLLMMLASVLCGITRWYAPCYCFSSLDSFARYPDECGFPNLEVVATVFFCLLLMPSFGPVFMVVISTFIIILELLQARCSLIQAFCSVFVSVLLYLYLTKTPFILRIADAGVALVAAILLWCLSSESILSEYLPWSFPFFTSALYLVFSVLYGMSTAHFAGGSGSAGNNHSRIIWSVFTADPSTIIESKTRIHRSPSRHDLFSGVGSAINRERVVTTRFSNVCDQPIAQLINASLIVVLILSLALVQWRRMQDPSYQYA